MTDEGLTNHEITICLSGGAVLGPFKATWTKEMNHDVRELSKNFEAYLEGGKQTRYKYHLHDHGHRVSHTLILDFQQVTAIYDHVDLRTNE
jgi:hypothetical protein